MHIPSRTRRLRIEYDNQHPERIWLCTCRPRNQESIWSLLCSLARSDHQRSHCRNSRCSRRSVCSHLWRSPHEMTGYSCPLARRHPWRHLTLRPTTSFHCLCLPLRRYHWPPPQCQVLTASIQLRIGLQQQLTSAPVFQTRRTERLGEPHPTAQNKKTA